MLFLPLASSTRFSLASALMPPRPWRLLIVVRRGRGAKARMRPAQAALASANRSMIETARRANHQIDFGEDSVGGLDPDEGLRIVQFVGRVSRPRAITTKG